MGAYGYDPATGRLDWFGDESNIVPHDANGNIERIGDVELIWNPFDKVERLSRPGEQLAFTYDADGQRVARFDGTGFTLTLGGLFELSSHEAQGGSVERRARYFVPAGSSTVEVRDTELQAGTWDREVLYQYTDHLGSGSVLVADDGSVDPSDRVSYDAWGQARDWFQWNQSFDPSLLQDFAAGFTGHQPELDAGLVNMRGRMYSSELARFLSVDPVVEAAGDAQTWNGYSYVLNNPLRFVDPSGFSADPTRPDTPCEISPHLCPEPGGETASGEGGDGKDRGSVPQRVPGHDAAPSGNTSSDTANNAGGGGGKSGVGGGSTSKANARGEGGRKAEMRDAMSDSFLNSVDTFLRVATPAGRLFTTAEMVGRAALDIHNGKVTIAIDPETGEVVGLLWREPYSATTRRSGVFKDDEFYQSFRAREVEKSIESAGPPGGAAGPQITKPYKRPSGATTKAQRESVQGKPCVDCGKTTSRQFADHKKPLVKEYYETGTVDRDKMRSTGAVQPQCPTCSSSQGGAPESLVQKNEEVLRPMKHDDDEMEQKRLCADYGARWVESAQHLKVGVARNLKSGMLPINGLRHPPKGDTTGWYLWAGEEISTDPDFFVPVHLEHLDDWRPGLTRYLGLAPGWRFLIDPEAGHEDVWEDPSLLEVDG